MSRLRTRVPVAAKRVLATAGARATISVSPAPAEDRSLRSNVIRRHLYPALKELGYVDPCTGTHKAGNHAFRRYRNTHLWNETSCPKRTSLLLVGTNRQFDG